MGLAGTLWFAAFILTLFFCVLLHEYGHALTAKKIGVKTRDIILTPIGGMARLEKLPEKPIHEFIVAIAGPAVNIVIAIFLGLFIFFFLSPSLWIHTSHIENLFNGRNFLKLIFWMNILLCGFNLIPAFPMDGGRILRSLLSMRYGKLRSTRIASFIGKLIAVSFFITGIVILHLFLALIGIFVFFMALQEGRAVKVEELLSKYKVNKIFNRNIIMISQDDKMEVLISYVYQSIARNFLVFEKNEIIGCIPELFIRDAIKNNSGHKMAKEYMSDKYSYTSPDKSVLEVYQTMNENGYSIMAVRDQDQILGYIDRSMIQNLVESSSNLK